jgi:UPF0271 protein
MASEDPDVAAAVVRGVRTFDRELLVYAMPHTHLARAAEAAGLRVVVEGFADRAYEPDGRLAPRSRAGAVIHDPAAIAARALRMAKEQRVLAADGTELQVSVDSICLHGDTDWAAEAARQVRTALESAGVVVTQPRIQK